MTTASPSFTKEIRRNRENRDYDMFLDGQYIGSRATYHQAEIDLDAHVLELLSSDLVIPATVLDGACGDCGQALDSLGLCGCGNEEPTDVCPSCGDQLSWSGPGLCGACQEADELTDQDFDQMATAADLMRHCKAGTAAEALEMADSPTPLSCSICGQPAPILEAHGAFCAGCWEAQGLWLLWKRDSTTFVWSLRQQRARLNEMAERLATYLSRKNNAHLSMDSILAMWRQLLDDDGPPEPCGYVVAAQRQVAA